MDLKKIFKRDSELLSAYHSLFAQEDPSSQFVLHDLMKFTNMLQPSHVENNSHQTAYEEGKRAVMLYIFHKLQITPQELQNRLMLAAQQDQENMNG